MGGFVMRVLVVGGSGFLGSHVSDELTAKGCNVTIFDREYSKWKSESQRMVIGDVLSSDSLDKEVSQSDAVYMLAAIADIGVSSKNPYNTINMNVLGSIKVIELCVKYNVRVIFGSTIYVYSAQGSFYRASKQAVEVLIETYESECNLNCTIVRYGSLYGPRAQKWNGLRRIVEEMVLNKEIIYGGTGKERREYIHVMDAAKMSVDILDDKYIGKSITLTGVQVLTSTDLLEMISEIISKDIRIKFDESNSTHSHYKLTPYQYLPKSSIKLISTEYRDIGEGLLELISEVYSSMDNASL